MKRERNKENEIEVGAYSMRALYATMVRTLPFIVSEIECHKIVFVRRILDLYTGDKLTSMTLIPGLTIAIWLTKS